MVLSNKTICYTVQGVPPLSDGHAADRHLPDNLRRYRELKGMSQAGLAREMSERGWPWHQPTVYKIETGKQGVTLGEAADLAAILGVSTDRLTWADAEATEMGLVDRDITVLRRAALEAATAVARLLAARYSGTRTLESARVSKYARIRQVAADLEAELAERTVSGACERAVDLYEQAGEG